MKKIIAIIAGLLLSGVGLYGIFGERNKTASDYINVEGPLEFAKVWWGPYDSVPRWVRGPSRTRIEVTPHLWLKLQNDSALFLLSTASGKDQQLATILKPGAHTKIYFHYEKSDGAYPVKQIEQNNEVVFSPETIKNENTWIGIVVLIIGIALFLFGLMAMKKSRKASAVQR